MCIDKIEKKCFEVFRNNSKIFKASKNSKTYEMENSFGKTISKVSFDLCKGANESCCDYLFIVEDTIDNYIFVELKGAEVPDALEQLYASVNKYKHCLTNKKLNGRIITSKTYRPDLQRTDYLRLRKLFKNTDGELITNSQQFKEKV